jgi:hypothetical protein
MREQLAADVFLIGVGKGGELSDRLLQRLDHAQL